MHKYYCKLLKTRSKMSEIITEFKTELEKVKNAIDERLLKADEQSKLAGTVAQDVKSELANLAKKYNEVEGLSKKQQDHLDKLQAEIQKGGFRSGGSQKSFRDLLNEKLTTAYPDGKVTKGSSLELDMKAAAAMTIAANTTGEVAEIERIRGIRGIVPRLNHVREFMTITATDKTAVNFTAETGGEGDPAMTAEGAEKTLIDSDFEQKTANVRKIAARMVISDEMLDDIPDLANHLSTRGVERLLIVEDAQLLTGAGTGQNLTGLSINAVTATSFGYKVTTPQKWDVLGASVGKLASANYISTAIMLNTVDFHEMALLKDTQGRYLAPIMWTNGVPSIHGVPVAITNAIAAGSFLVGNFSMGAEIKQRQGLGVRFFEETLAANNQVLVVIEERLALPIYYPSAFLYDTFADGIADLTAP
jgi:HK97 family phage major capsid protein